MRKLLTGLSIIVASVFAAAPASASLIGTSVTGSLNFSGSPNFFITSFTPVTATISGSAVEFSGGVSSINSFYADFNDGSLKIVDAYLSGSDGIASLTYTFIDAAFAGLILGETSDSFPNGGASATLVGTTLTVVTPEFEAPGTYTVTYSLAAATVPEPTSIALFGLGLLGFAAARRKSAK